MQIVLSLAVPLGISIGALARNIQVTINEIVSEHGEGPSDIEIAQAH